MHNLNNMTKNELLKKLKSRFPEQAVWCKVENHRKGPGSKHKYVIFRKPNNNGEEIQISTRHIIELEA